VGTVVDDTVITSSVKSALLADAAINSFDLQVQTRKGTVQLSGFVDSQAQIDQALAITRGVSGVTAVENGVTLKGAPSTVGTKLDDTVITSSVKTALLADSGIKSFDISVLTFKGEVQLTGFVNNQGQIDQATRIARTTEGASSVKNELKIKQ
jgi:hyperosmotically inducible protein